MLSGPITKRAWPATPRTLTKRPVEASVLSTPCNTWYVWQSRQVWFKHTMPSYTIEFSQSRDFSWDAWPSFPQKITKCITIHLASSSWYHFHDFHKSFNSIISEHCYLSFNQLLWLCLPMSLLHFGIFMSSSNQQYCLRVIFRFYRHS